MKDKRVVFMGTPDFSVPVLEMLIENTNVIMVVTQKDSYVGRHHELTFSPVKKVAIKHNIEVYQPEKIRKEYEHILEAKPDIIITCAYGQIIPEILLNTPEYKAINVHASLLPKLRGGSPLHRAIMEGYKETGITIMYMATGMDDGDIIKQKIIKINDEDNVGIIHDKLSLLGRDLLLEVLPSIFDKTNDRIKQDESEVTFAWVIKREDEHIDFNKTVEEVDRKVRGLYSVPLANTIINDVEYKIVKGHYEIGESTVNKINVINKKQLGIGCSNGIYYIDEIKPSGKKIMRIQDFLNGVNIEVFKDYEIK